MEKFEERRSLVASQVVCDPFERRRKCAPNLLTAMRTHGKAACPHERCDGIAPVDREIAGPKRWALGENGADARLETFVVVASLGQPAPDDIRGPQRELTLECLDADTAYESSERFRLEARVGRIHMVLYERPNVADDVG